MKPLLAFFLLGSFAQAIDYPLVAVRSAKLATKVTFPEVFQATNHPPSDLVILKPDGTLETLVSGEGKHALLDPKPSLDGKWVYYARIEDTALRGDGGHPVGLPYKWTDIYRVEVATKKIVRITDHVWQPPEAVADWLREDMRHEAPWKVRLTAASMNWGVSNLGPCPIPGGKLVFTSDRRGYRPTKGSTTPNLQLHILDDIPGVTDQDGEANRNVECTGHLNVGSALHPILLTTGEIAWSSSEAQGLRDGRIWCLWRSYPDGRKWGPIYSAMIDQFAFHFHGQRSDGSIACLCYYLLNNNGTGTLIESPLTVDSPEFLSPDKSKVPPLQWGYFWGQSTPTPEFGGFPFQRRGTYMVTPWITPQDRPNGYNENGAWKPLGKVTHPSGAPNNHLLIAYTTGGGNDNGTHGAAFMQPYHFQVGLIKTKTTAGPHDIEILLKDDQFHFTQPVALVPWKTIYGSDPPEIPFVPNPTGTPFGIVGSSSAHQGQWKPQNPNSNTGYQGFWAGQDIDETGADKTKIPSGIDVIALAPNPARPRGEWNAGDWYNAADERMRLLARIKFDEPDRPAGDTSWWAKIPADTPFQFRTFDSTGRTITLSQTWRQVRPGEVMTACGGCHNHSGDSIPFAESGVSDLGTYASTQPATDFRETILRMPEFNRDVLPIFQAKCLECHGADSTNPVKLHDGLALAKSSLLMPGQAFRSRLSKAVHGEGTTKQMPFEREPLTAAEMQTIDEWIDFMVLYSTHAESTGKGAWLDDLPPTLFVSRSGPLKVGAYDYQSGLASVTVNGEAVTLADHAWTGPELKPGDVYTVVAKDKAGNTTKIERFIRGTAPTPPPTPTASGVYLGLDGDNVGPARQGTPDGKPDHHIKLTGLKPNYNRIIVHFGATKWSNEAEIPIVLGRPSIPGSPLGVLDLWFAPQASEAATKFTVYIRYADGTEDQIETTAEAPTGDTEALKQRIAVLEAEAQKQAAKLEEFWQWLATQPKK